MDNTFPWITKKSLLVFIAIVGIFGLFIWLNSIQHKKCNTSKECANGVCHKGKCEKCSTTVPCDSTFQCVKAKCIPIILGN